MPRERKLSSKLQFLQDSSQDWEDHQEHLEATKDQRKRGPRQAGGLKKGKKPLSSFMHFCNAMRNEVKEEYPDATFGEVGKILGEWWSDCSPQEKQKYEHMSQSQRDNYYGGNAPAVSARSNKKSYLDMAKEAIAQLRNRKGSSHQAIEDHIKSEYPEVDFKRHLLNKTLKTNSQKGVLVRSGNSFRFPSD